VDKGREWHYTSLARSRLRLSAAEQLGLDWASECPHRTPTLKPASRTSVGQDAHELGITVQEQGSNVGRSLTGAQPAHIARK